MSAQRYILVAGQGRSGTNWILEILDLSRQTHCRNEPNECIGSALSELPSGQVFRRELTTNLERTWDDAVARTAKSFGARDQNIAVYKDHFIQAAQRVGLTRIVRAKKPHRVFGAIARSVPREEWPVPSWMINRWHQASPVPVHKLNMVPGWIVWVLRNRPEAHIVHIVRHPGGYLNSLTKRLWSTLDMGKVERDNRERLAEIAAYDPSWSDRFGDLAVLSPVEMELWYWRYACETIHQAGAGNPRCQLVTYEELTCHPAEVSRSVYDGCGLSWDATIEAGIERLSGESKAIAAAWRNRLDADQIAAVERILSDSVMRDWWAESDRDGAEWPGGRLSGADDARISKPVESAS